jgi:tetratricopeptide (TPR) repeat protein/HAMP domain-containing protein
MDKLHDIANRAKLRILLGTSLRHGIRWLMCLAGIALVLTMVDRSGEASFMPWNMIWIVLGAVGVLLVISKWNQQKISRIEAAAEVDQKMGLRDRISSAIACDREDSPFCGALIDDALEVVEREDVQSKLPQHFPVELPRESGWVVAIALSTLLVTLLPQWGLWNEHGGNLQQASVLPSVENIEASVDSVLEQFKNENSLSDSLQKELDELASISAIEGQDPESLRREALRKMTDLQKKLDELMQDENALTFKEVSRRLQALELPRDAQTLPLIAAMKNGDFDQAKRELDSLVDQLDSSELTEEQRKELAKALEELAKQLEKLASANEALASALAAAGLNEALAGNPEAAMQAIKNSENLNEEQKKKLLDLLKAQQNASEMCKKMGQGCMSCAKGEGSGGMASELEQLQAMQMFKTEAEIAKMACNNAAMGMCPGQGSTGGVGQGDGGMNPTEETDTTSVAQRSPVNTLEGTIIARQLFEGGFLTSSESTATVRETVLTEQRNVEQAIADEEVPRKYHELLRHYFGRLEELTETSVDDADQSSD